MSNLRILDLQDKILTTSKALSKLESEARILQSNIISLKKLQHDLHQECDAVMHDLTNGVGMVGRILA